MDPMRRRQAERGRSPSSTQTVQSSISSMDTVQRRQLPPENRAAASENRETPLIPNFVMSPGTLESDTDHQREVRVDEDVREPMYGTNQEPEEVPTSSATQRSQSVPSPSHSLAKSSPLRPRGLPSGLGSEREVPRPTDLPRDARSSRGINPDGRAGGERVGQSARQDLGLEELHPDYRHLNWAQARKLKVTRDRGRYSSSIGAGNLAG